jgi:hypothetical protein
LRAAGTRNAATSLGRRSSPQGWELSALTTRNLR